MLVSLENKPYANMTIPGKVQSYMASGKAIIGSINGSCAAFIKQNGIGYVCQSGNAKALANLIRGLDVSQLKSIGRHSKEVYLKDYSKKKFIDQLSIILEDFVKLRV